MGTYAMGKKSKKKTNSNPTWDDATVDKHLKPTLAQKKIWWPDKARKNDLVALLKKNDVTLEEVMKGKKPKKYKRPEKPESEAEDSEGEDTDETEVSDGDEDDDDGENEDDDEDEEEEEEEEIQKTKKDNKGTGRDKTIPSKPAVELEQFEHELWKDAELLKCLPHLAQTTPQFKSDILAYSTTVKGNSPHSLAAFWFFVDSMVGKYENDTQKRDNKIGMFAYRPKFWELGSKNLHQDPAAWVRWQQLTKLERAKVKAFGRLGQTGQGRKKEKGKGGEKEKKKVVYQSSDGSDSEVETSDKDDSDDPFADTPQDGSEDESENDSESDSDDEDGGKRSAYDSKKARQTRGLCSGKAADKMEVADPERGGKKVKADIIGRHPTRKSWLVLALPSNNKKHPGLSRGHCIDGTDAKYSAAFERYLEDGSNRTLSTGSEVNLKKCAPHEFELNLVTSIPWGKHFHSHGYGIKHKKKGEFMMFSKQVLGKAWNARDADDVLRDHMIKAGQPMPGREGKEIKAKSWGK
ncbi:hypothetical protein NLG97_g8578 [Lecanicillium saksenae]|uniref:Uncharacterized protein n=1 Tax=Lecanicillium saksenae TaxID=468837 RepID=A0ACC1QLU5_9HYPO|nr:hypothetical protein NLG97_g8578 [Lecanicillium saksenae]